MKKIIVFAISILCVLSPVGRGSKAVGNTITDKPYTGAPKIVLNGQDYFADEAVIVSELPEGYSYAGELTDREKEFAYINGEKYYLPDGVESIEDFYVYQECGTPVIFTRYLLLIDSAFRMPKGKRQNRRHLKRYVWDY